jgi:hypothetical protein
MGQKIFNPVISTWVESREEKNVLFSKKSTINGKINSLQEDPVLKLRRCQRLYHFYSSPERNVVQFKN